jgi:RNA polymerase sigma-70 factor (ECF subfamily)
MSTSISDIERLYRERYYRFRNGLLPLTGSYDLAHDAVQEAFALAIAEFKQFRGEGSLEGWIWRIAVHETLRNRRNGRERQLFDVVEEVGFVPEQDPELAEAIRALPTRRRLIVFLRYFGDLSYDEIANVCEISKGTVAASLAQAHTALRKTLHGKDQVKENHGA